MKKPKILEHLKKLQKSDIYLTLWVSILSSLVATFITYQFNTEFSKITARNNLVSNIQHLYIGSNKEWVDSKFGPATFTNEEGEYLESVYVTDIAVLRIFYEQHTNSCRAFFVTLLSKNSSDKIVMSDTYSNFIVSGKPLGTYSYYEIDSEPIHIWGYISNGPGRAFYGESYYYASAGNYHYFYFLTLDYGTLDFERDIATIKLVGDLPNSTIDDEVSLDQLYENYIQIITNRDSSCPNTYGISSLSEDDTIELITFYDGFDSLQLRDNNGFCP